MGQLFRHTLVVEIICRIMRKAEPFHHGNRALIVLDGEGYKLAEFAHRDGMIDEGFAAPDASRFRQQARRSSVVT